VSICGCRRPQRSTPFPGISALLPSPARLGLDGSFAPIVPLAGWLPLQDRLARLSTNSSHRLVSYTHDAVVTDRRSRTVGADHS
jgi:hypothetical protein